VRDCSQLYMAELRTCCQSARSALNPHGVLP